MSRVNRKLVFKATSSDTFELVKSANTLEFGVPGDTLDKDAVLKIIKDHVHLRPGAGKLDVETVGNPTSN